jgi:probable rRNA maturation factor
VSIEIANESGYQVDADEIVAVARHALDEMGVNPLAELSVLLVDVDYMTELNHRWMGGDGPTDVLAFPMDEETIDHGPADGRAEPALLGDIVLCPAVAEKQAETYGSDDPRMRLPDAPPPVPIPGYSTAHELQMLTVHGVLHLLGFDHAEPDEEREMFGLQAKLLSGWRGRAR